MGGELSHRSSAADAAGAGVAAVGLDGAGEGSSGGAGFDGGVEHGGRGASAEGAVGTTGVVVLGEDSEVVVEAVRVS